MAFMPDGISVPAAWNYGAVERALRQAGNRGGRSIFEPTIGAVLVHYNFPEVPPGLIMKRWTREAKSDINDEAAVAIAQQRSRAVDESALRTLVYSAAMELVGLSSSSRQAFEVGLDFISRAKKSISSMTVVSSGSNAPLAPVVIENSDGTVTDGPSDLVMDLDGASAPPRVRSRGRPVQSRFKSPIESPGCRKRKRPLPSSAPRAGAPPPTGGDGVAGDVPVRQSSRLSGKTVDVSALCARAKKKGSVVMKCRVCGAADHYASACPNNKVKDRVVPSARQCRACGELGHYRTTCGRKSTYASQKSV
ncbi:hypothetical protein EJB05_50065 [Eragrostis curvula]|uniref:CCHC-type domain-containing protein n=1 Tax=Eragrostis curvula TaxID=38414 RepID=A0A5J9SZ59_9POAL|nr:hypothetical protein EJB05_50065 [Eragrostis curvula]